MPLGIKPFELFNQRVHLTNPSALARLARPATVSLVTIHCPTRSSIQERVIVCASRHRRYMRGTVKLTLTISSSVPRTNAVKPDSGQWVEQRRVIIDWLGLAVPETIEQSAVCTARLTTQRSTIRLKIQPHLLFNILLILDTSHQ